MKASVHELSPLAGKCLTVLVGTVIYAPPVMRIREIIRLEKTTLVLLMTKVPGAVVMLLDIERILAEYTVRSALAEAA